MSRAKVPVPECMISEDLFEEMMLAYVTRPALVHFARMEFRLMMGDRPNGTEIGNLAIEQMEDRISEMERHWKVVLPDVDLHQRTIATIDREIDFIEEEMS